MTNIADSLAGGALIGLAATGLMVLNGRIAGISGILAGLAHPSSDLRIANGAFVAGLLMIAPFWRLATGAWPAVHVTTATPLLIAGGLLVGFGTRLGAGCTSGHGVCGLARLSPISLAAVLTFLVTAIVTVTLMRILGL
jgi:uncharacterized membrane protein YedE/YeeE